MYRKDMYRKSTMPWWFWFAAVMGAFSFVPLLTVGIKLKKWHWIIWGAVQLILLFAISDDSWLFNLEILFWIVSAIIVFTVVRKDYVGDLERQRLEYLSLYEASRQAEVKRSQPLKAWTCEGCGAENNNATGICEYCGVALKS